MEIGIKQHWLAANLRNGAVVATLASCMVGAGPGRAAPAYTEFDVPGSAGTYAFAVNDKNAITGEYDDQDSHEHGFIRNPDATIITFDGPSATQTYALAINRAGSVVGSYQVGSAPPHGFLRTAGGTLITLDVPGASQGTYPYAINARGLIAGYFVDASYIPHGFSRDVNGSITTFDVPNASGGTYAESVNSKGAIAGEYLGGDGISHGFLRSADGSMATFDVPTALATTAHGIDDRGAITGYYTDRNTLEPAGFLRKPDGQIKIFSTPGTELTFPLAIARERDGSGPCITGWVKAVNGGDLGFLRQADGTIATFQAPDAAGGTLAMSISAHGSITGYYYDVGGVGHSFLRLP